MIIIHLISKLLSKCSNTISMFNLIVIFSTLTNILWVFRFCGKNCKKSLCFSYNFTFWGLDISYFWVIPRQTTGKKIDVSKNASNFYITYLTWTIIDEYFCWPFWPFLGHFSQNHDFHTFITCDWIFYVSWPRIIDISRRKLI